LAKRRRRRQARESTARDLYMSWRRHRQARNSAVSI
jgi:hypothetical protein